MRYTIITLCVLIASLEQVMSDDVDRPVVETSSGRYRGHVLKTRGGRDVLAFQGIPYALPPTGQLRFKDPVRSPKLEGIYEANNEHKVCFQPSFDFRQMKNFSTYVGSEDCLYLNVYKPKIDEMKGPLPVFVWIHGGGFLVGSGSSFWNGPEYLLDKDMIFVTTNYRLGSIGFMSNGNNVLPGNFGMKDQVMALEWVKDNIASFGGDPNSVTIGGESAGGSSVSLHMHSPLSKGLFHRVIAQSGTAYCPFSTKSWEHAREDAKKVATYLGCSFDSEKLLKCLQKMPLKELVEAANTIAPPDILMSLDFVPVIEKPSQAAFLTKKSLNEPSDLPLVTGVTSNECIHILREFALINPKYKNDMDVLLKDVENFLPLLGFYNRHPKKDEITQKLAKFYYGGRIEDANELETTECYSDLMFNHGLHLTGKKEKGPIYLYKFSYKTSYDFRPPQEGIEGVGHGEDLMYLFDIKLFQRDKEWPSEDTDMSNKILELWYNFISSGDPTPDSKLWEESGRGVKYLDITNDGLHMKSNMFQARMQLLDDLNIENIYSAKHEEL